MSSLSLPSVPVASLRKRVTGLSPKQSPAHASSYKYTLVRDLDPLAPSKKNPNKYKVFPLKNRSAEEFTFVKSSSRESSDCDFEHTFTNRRPKNVSYKNEEKSQLICYKDDTKIIAIKNDSKLTRYNTFDTKHPDRQGKMTKYKSLDEPETKTLVKYMDKYSNVSISAEDFDSDFKLMKYDQKRPKHDIISNTVDAWAKKSSKNMFSNIKNSIFKSGANSTDKEIVFKPLVFGGTFPIDAPTGFHEKVAGRHKVKDLYDKIEKLDSCRQDDFRKHRAWNRPTAVFREYGPAKSFDIDAPII